MKYLLTINIALFCLLLACKSDGPQSTTQSNSNTLGALETILAKNPNDHKSLYTRAKQQYSNQDYSGAIESLKAAVDIDSLQADYQHLLTDCYLDYYRSKDALMTMIRASQTFPERVPTLLKLAETQLIVKLYEESMLTVARVINIEPNNAEAQFMIGMNFKEMGETDRAINYFQKTTELDPEIIDAWLILGDLYQEKGDKKAIDYYNAALNVDSDNIAALHSKAFHLQNDNKELEAIDLYKRINLIDKNYTDAYLNSGILYLAMDSIDLSMEQFNILTGIKPQDYLPHYYKGLIYQSKGDIDNARKAFQNSINLNSDFSRAKKALNALDE